MCIFATKNYNKQRWPNVAWASLPQHRNYGGDAFIP